MHHRLFSLRDVRWEAISLQWSLSPQHLLCFGDPELEDLYINTIASIRPFLAYFPVVAAYAGGAAVLFMAIHDTITAPLILTAVTLGALFFLFGIWRLRGSLTTPGIEAGRRLEMAYAGSYVLIFFPVCFIMVFLEQEGAGLSELSMKAGYAASTCGHLILFPARGAPGLVSIVAVAVIAVIGFAFVPNNITLWRVATTLFFQFLCPFVTALIADYERRVQFIAAAQLARVDSRITRELEVSVQAVQERVPPRVLRHLFRGRPLWDDSDECVLVLLRVAPPASVPLHQKVRTLQAAAAAHAEHSLLHGLLEIPCAGDLLGAADSPAFVRRRNRVAAPAIGACLVARAVDVAARAASGRPVVSGAVHCEAALVAIASASLVPTVLGGVLPACTAVLAAATAAGGVVVTWPVRERVVSETVTLVSLAEKHTHSTELIATAFPHLIPGPEVVVASALYSGGGEQVLQCYWLMLFNNTIDEGSIPQWCARPVKPVSTDLTLHLRQAALGFTRKQRASGKLRECRRNDDAEWQILESQYDGAEFEWSWQNIVDFPFGPFADRSAEERFVAQRSSHIVTIISAAAMVVLHLMMWIPDAAQAMVRSGGGISASVCLAFSAAAAGAGVGFYKLKLMRCIMNTALAFLPPMLAGVGFLIGDESDAVANRFGISLCLAAQFVRPRMPWKCLVGATIFLWVPMFVIVLSRGSSARLLVTKSSFGVITTMALLQAERQARKFFAVTDTARRTLRASKLEIDAVRAVLAATAGSAELADLDPSRPPAARCLLALDVGPHVRRTPLSTPLSLVAEVAARQQELDSIAAEFRPWCHAVRGSGPTKWFITLRDDAECAAALAHLATVLSRKYGRRASGVLHRGPVTRVTFGQSNEDPRIVTGLSAEERFVGAGVTQAEAVLVQAAQVAGCMYATGEFVSGCPATATVPHFDSCGIGAVKGLGRTQLFLLRDERSATPT